MECLTIARGGLWAEVVIVIPLFSIRISTLIGRSLWAAAEGGDRPDRHAQSQYYVHATTPSGEVHPPRILLLRHHYTHARSFSPSHSFFLTLSLSLSLDSYFKVYSPRQHPRHPHHLPLLLPSPPQHVPHANRTFARSSGGGWTRPANLPVCVGRSGGPPPVTGQLHQCRQRLIPPHRRRERS